MNHKIIIILTIIYYILTFAYGITHRFHYVTINGTIYSKNILEIDSDVIAWAVYDNNVNKTGWANLEIHSTKSAPDDQQALYAGLLEGYITGELISMHWYNLYGHFCIEEKEFCDKLKEFIKTNQEFVNRNIQLKSKTEQYWHHVSLVYAQIRGLQKGYDNWEITTGYKRPPGVEPVDLFMLNLDPEMGELEEVLVDDDDDDEDDDEESEPKEGHCSAIIKPLSDGSDLFVAHNTWSNINCMLRVMKKYDFSFMDFRNKSSLIPGHAVSMSSYPGLIFSEDDYYILSSGLVVQETTNENFNKSLWKQIHADQIVFEFIRNIVANRLAKTGQEWTEIYALHNSGTYNNQFMIVDYNKYTPGTKVKQLSDGLLWVIEQMPGIIRSADVTHVIRERGYWASYNVPYFKDIFDITDSQKLVKKYGNYYTYNYTARALIFRRDESKVIDLKSLYKLMRFNDFKHDPLSLCKVYNQTCDPPYSADMGIASRNDLNDPKGNYPLTEWIYRGEAAIDVKITNHEMVKSLQMLAVSGPTYEQQPPFRWSTANFTDIKHKGHPDLFDFKPIFVKWYPLNSIDANGF